MSRGPAVTQAPALPAGSTGERDLHPAEITWLLEMTQSPVRIRQRAATTVTTGGLALGAVAAAVWLYDLALLAAH